MKCSFLCNKSRQLCIIIVMGHRHIYKFVIAAAAINRTMSSTIQSGEKGNRNGRKKKAHTLIFRITLWPRRIPGPSVQRH
jgi:hypothetical protein